jgi:TPR repeat protein
MSEEKVLTELIESAEQGNAENQTILGNIYAAGDGVPEDLTKALFWWEKAAKQNDMEATHHMASALYDGNGVQKNIPEAMDLWLNNAKKEDDFAQNMLGSYHAQKYNHNGEKKDLVYAISWWEKSALNHNYISIYELSLFYKSLYIEEEETLTDNYLILSYAWLLAVQSKLSGTQELDEVSSRLLPEINKLIEEINSFMQVQMYNSPLISEGKRERLRQEAIDDAKAKSELISKEIDRSPNIPAPTANSDPQCIFVHRSSEIFTS